ncbi:MAG: amidohydrolase family protein, partial [Phycisphaerales bacterium]|nr:amidohydrolase family protein [Phycisphaerales bacterium]
PTGGNFWTWRQTMYQLAGALNVDAFHQLSRQAFEQMLRAGITTVGEFHYLHHAGNDCADWEFDHAILAAAREAGIRLVLIQCYYATGGMGCPLQGAQRRFGPVSRQDFLRQVDHLGRRLDPSRQTLALACHSVRAAEPEDLKYIRDAAAGNGWPFHIHVEEVHGEIEQSLARHQRRPLRLLLETIGIDPAVTAIHCTHSHAEDLTEFSRRGGGVCLCPITEGNLADGFADLPWLRHLGTRLAIGTDCNLRISPLEELRWLEFGQRLHLQRRGIVVDASGFSAAGLLQVGTLGGALSLGVNSGQIAPGRLADLVAVDLRHPDLAGIDAGALADALVFGCGNGPVDQVWIGGVPVNPPGQIRAADEPPAGNRPSSTGR